MPSMIVSQWRLLLGPLVAVSLFFLANGHPDLSVKAAWVAAITGLCACWWILEPIPIPVTSLIPIALLPLLSVLKPSEVAEAYGHPVILLLMAGCILSTAMEKSGAHKKIAMHILHLVGEGSMRRVVFGFMVASAFLSMWISNTATTLMLLPVAMAVISSTRHPQFAVPLLLGLCYGASIGGMGTPIGTPPNLILRGIYEETTGLTIGFTQWMMWGLPVVILFIPLAGFWLTRGLNQKCDFEFPEQGAWTSEQKRVLCIFGLTALAWMTRTDPFGGWRTLLNLPQADDANVALIAVVAMFILPNGKGRRLLDWETAVKIPWGMLLLFSGGIALAKGFVTSGLAEFLAGGLSGLAVLPTFVMILFICLGVTFLTEVTSNTASTSLLMPVLAVAAVGANLPPLMMMLPAALSASCAFMLPVATAPNAIVFGSGKVTVVQMARQGFVLNIAGAILIASWVSFIL